MSFSLRQLYLQSFKPHSSVPMSSRGSRYTTQENLFHWRVVWKLAKSIFLCRDDFEQHSITMLNAATICNIHQKCKEGLLKDYVRDDLWHWWRKCYSSKSVLRKICACLQEVDLWILIRQKHPPTAFSRTNFSLFPWTPALLLRRGFPSLSTFQRCRLLKESRVYRCG